MARARRLGRREREPVVLTDPRAIKALAHPARLAVLDALFEGGQLTATECAELAGLSPSAMSYHLRALERWGIVERADASDDGRERPWRAAGGGLRIESAEPSVSALAESTVVTRLLDQTRRDVLGWVSSAERDQPPWRDITTVASGTRWMTDHEAEQLAKEFDELLDRYRRTSASDRPAGAHRVRVSFVMVPTDLRD
ncbi:MAG TPA: winged helix-turn-helix domain-containing protein [Jatrophihabitantaceae bacterium]|nr:winged helix-turn-helix domain-containing protein [Jatrophihabitantaceae bacterium]